MNVIGASQTISGAWTYPGYSDRPFIYTVTPLATSATSRSFLTYLVEARQPLAPHPFPSGAAAVSRGPAKLPPLGPTAFSALVSLVPPSPHLSPPPATSLSPGPAPQLPLVHVTSSSPSPQQRFASVLASRAPEEWPLAPGVDVTGVLRRVTIPQQLSRKSFPGVELRKVDMSSWNAGREPWERTELLAYRLIVPPSPTQEARDDGDVDSDAKTEGCETDEADEPNLHAALHVFVSDRNGILMAANHLGFGEGLGRTCSLTCAYVVHVDAEDCVMRRRGRSAAEGATSPRSSAPVTASPWKGQWDNDGEWWISEVSFPRAAVGRATVLSRIWSPGGVHVATAYQDGSVRSFEMEVYSCQRKVPPETGGKLGKL